MPDLYDIYPEEFKKQELEDEEDEEIEDDE